MSRRSDLDALAEDMVPLALDLVCNVHDRAADACHAILAPLPMVQLRALAVVLAALVPDDWPTNDLMARTHGGAHVPRSGEPVSELRAWRNRLVLAEALGTTDGYPTGRRAEASR